MPENAIKNLNMLLVEEQALLRRTVALTARSLTRSSAAFAPLASSSGGTRTCAASIGTRSWSGKS